MARFTLPRDLYHGKGALEALKNLKGTRAMVCVGGGSMKRFGFLDQFLHRKSPNLTFGPRARTFSTKLFIVSENLTPSAADTHSTLVLSLSIPI